MSAAPAKFHGLLKDHLRKHLLIALAVSSATAAAWQVLVAAPRKQAYADFYKTYDADADNERMTKLGLFQSKQP